MIDDLNIADLPSMPLSERAAFPKCAAIYFAVTPSNEPLYIGLTQNLDVRWKDHHKLGALNALPSVRVAWLELEGCAHMFLHLESSLIKRFQPRLNGCRRIFPVKTLRLPSVRLSTEELKLVLKAAELEETRPSDFIRKALAEKVNKLSRRHPELEQEAA